MVGWTLTCPKWEESLRSSPPLLPSEQRSSSPQSDQPPGRVIKIKAFPTSISWGNILHLTMQPTAHAPLICSLKKSHQSRPAESSLFSFLTAQNLKRGYQATSWEQLCHLSMEKTNASKMRLFSYPPTWGEHCTLQTVTRALNAERTYWAFA